MLSAEAPGLIGSASPTAGGSPFLADPDVRADRQPLFWRPEVDPNVVILAALPTRSDEAISFTAAEWPGEFIARVAPDGLYGLLIDARREHRLFFPDHLSDGAGLAALIPFDETTLLRAEATLRLWRFLSGRPSRGNPSSERRRRTRIASTLRALDGRLAGASYRMIAETLFGSARIESDVWKTASLRDATIRLVRAGVALMRGGYRQLLHSR